ncbi:DNA primase [Cardiobacteriaceae bacterium TAE3-ERU3]|nr:DNA primase [Cardiobacteriaceae bacterium TAE3-ERU3]
MAKSIAATFIQELNARTDLVKLIATRVDFRRHSGKNHYACCPFHNEKTPSFTVNEAEQYYHCFGCGASGDAIRFLMDHDHLTFVEAIESLADFNGMEVVYEERAIGDHQAQPRDKARHEQGLECLAAAAEYFQRMFYEDAGRQAREYLRGRKVSKSSVDHFMLGYAPRGNGLLEALGSRFSHEILEATGLIGAKDGRHYDWFRDRVMFPIRNVRGQVIGFGARAMDGGEPKYLNSGESEWFNKRHECYGLFEALQNGKRNQPLMVTEGYMDVVKLWQHGMDNAVAALGTAIGETHITQLKKRAKKVYFAFDGDTAGQKAAGKALEAVFRLHDEHHQWRFVFMPEGEDPDSLIEHDGVAAVQSLLDGSLTASQFLLRLLDQRLAGRDSVEADAEVASYAREWLGMLPESAYRVLLQEEIQVRFGLNAQTLGASVVAEGGHRKRFKRQRIERVLSNAPQTMDVRLTAMLLQFPDIADRVELLRQKAALDEALPLFCAAWYVVQSGAGKSVLESWLKAQDVAEVVSHAQRALENMSREHIIAELNDCLRVRAERIAEQQARLEKLGG